MKVILIAVASVNGKLTSGTTDNVSDWSSPEDFAHFQKVKSENNLIVMGSGTYNKVKDVEQTGFKPETDKLRIVLTSQPEKYKQFAVPGQLEFSRETPHALIKRLEQEGFTQMLLVAGSKVATAFFAANLIDEFWLTLEPIIFGRGDPMIAEKELNLKLKLLSQEQLNAQGTLLLKYSIVKP